MSATGSFFEVSDAAAVRTITIDRPQAKNALNGAMRSQLCSLLADADHTPGVRVVILTGTDPTFCAGVDFKDVEGSFDSYSAQFRVNPGKALRAMRTPVICAVNGACVSGGLELALSCSFVIGSDRARFADTHARLNAVPTWGLTALLPRAVGVRYARQMSITGDFVTAAEALRIGLVNEVVEHAQLLPRCRQIAEHVADTPAVTEVLALYERGTELSLQGALAAEADHTSRRSFDAAAFTTAGSAAAARQRESGPQRPAG